MKPAQYERNGHTIKDLSPGGKRKSFKAINEAKRESRELQMDIDGALGRGTVRLAS